MSETVLVFVEAETRVDTGIGAAGQAIEDIRSRVYKPVTVGMVWPADELAAYRKAVYGQA
jgi:hypothetical protein